MRQRVFLTGSTSYLGTKFIELYGSQFDIFGIARSDKINPINLLDFESVSRAFNDFKPDFVIHLAADLGRDYISNNQIKETLPSITSHLIELAKSANTPFIFTSTEAVYGGKETIGGYIETDELKPRSLYGEAKVESEKIIKDSGLPYLITRGHRYVGISKSFSKPKQFPDTLKSLQADETVHLDSHKIFTPFLINNACDVIAHYINNDSHKQLVLNVGVNKPTTFYDFVVDVAKALELDTALVKDDGEEAGWPENSSLSMKKLEELDYPTVSYEEMLDIIRTDPK